MRRLSVAFLIAAFVAAFVTAPTQARAAGPSVAAELARLQADGELAPSVAGGYRLTYDHARRTLRRLRGYRRAQLAAVLATVDATAADGGFAPTRLPALFLTLERNRAWWATAPIPPVGRRTTFPGSQIVWQDYRGQGWQIQWLATFGKANALWAARNRDPELRALIDEALSLATQRAGGIAFEYLFPFDGGSPPWVSGLAQGTALSALSRAAVRLRDPRLFDAARSALGIFETAPPDGVRVATLSGAEYLQYSSRPSLHVANGFTQALNGLHDFATLANDPQGWSLFNAGEGQLRIELPGVDTGAWSRYSNPGQESDLSYHSLLRDFLQGLCTRMSADRDRAAAAPAPVPAPAPAPGPDPAGPSTGGTPVAEAPAPSTPPPPPPPDPALYCDTAQRFSDDLRTPPVLAITSQTLRAQVSGKIRFTLSKVSTVSVTVTRDGRVVLARRMRMGLGPQRVDFRPARPGAEELRVRAVDLAGNAATATRTLAVLPGRRG